MDIRDFGAIHDFIALHMKRAGGGRGTRASAVTAAAKTFKVDPKTAERHYDRLRRSNTLDAAISLAWKDSNIEEGLKLIDRAFSRNELRALDKVDSKFVWKLARERIELIELRKQLQKRRRK